MKADQGFKPKSHWMTTREYTPGSPLKESKKVDVADIFFVNRKTIPWPPDPFRTLGARAILGYMHMEDRMFDRQ